MRKWTIIFFLAVAGLLASPQAASAQVPEKPAIKAVAFDFFVLFDANSMVPAVEAAFPGKGAAIAKLWRAKLFEYNFLRSISGRHEDFSKIVEDSLVYTARAMKLDLTPEQKKSLAGAFLRLKPWPDTVEGLRRLKDSGVRVIALSNFTPEMLRANADDAGIASFFDVLVSTEINGSFKPEPRAYQLGTDALGLKKENIVFAAFGGWDAFGAKSFGYPTIWVNRFGLPAEELAPAPDSAVMDMDGLVSYVLERR
jgi:2-haloacid dehalogenase